MGIIYYVIIIIYALKQYKLFLLPDCSMSQLAVAWCLKNESINCLLLGATSVDQFKENIHALQVHTLKIIIAWKRIIAIIRIIGTKHTNKKRKFY